MLLKYSVLLFFTLLPIFRYSDGQAVDDKCYKIPPIENFDVEKMKGYWYVQEVGDDDFAHRYCLEYEVFNDKKKSGTNMMCKATFKTKTGKKNITFTTVEVANSSQFITVVNGVLRSAWFVDTDYTTWGAYYICMPEQKDKGIIFIGTRAKYPSKETMEKAHNTLRRLGINVSKPYMQTLNHTTCD